MQMRISTGNSSQSLRHIPQSRNQKPPIIAYPSTQTSRQNVYYNHHNPYLLLPSPSQPRIKPQVRPSHSRQYTQASSQRSGKLVRANLLRTAQKPRISLVAQQSNAALTRTQQCLLERQKELVTQNKVLRGENQFLKEKLRSLQENKNKEIASLESRIQEVNALVAVLEKKVLSGESQWKDFQGKFAKNN